MSSLFVTIFFTGLLSLFTSLAYTQSLDPLDSNQTQQLFQKNLDRVLQLKAEQELLEQKKNVRLLQVELAELSHELSKTRDTSAQHSFAQDYRVIASVVQPSLTKFVIKHIPLERLFSWNSDELLLLDNQQWNFMELGKLGVKIMEDGGQQAWILY